jgi:hypothetical protein
MYGSFGSLVLESGYEKLHDQWGPDEEGRFIELGQGFPSILLGARAFLMLRWMMPGVVLRNVASRHRL